MPKTAWRTGTKAVLLLVACNGNVNTNTSRFGTQYDVTDEGVMRTALDPSGGQFEEPVQVSADWWQIRLGAGRQAMYLTRTDTPPDLSYYHFGRSGLQFPTRPTMVDLAIDGLDWHTGDSLQLVSPNVGTSIHDFEIHVAYPAEGA